MWVEATPRPPNLQGFRLPDRVAAHPHPSLSLGPNCSWGWRGKGSHWSCPGQSGSRCPAPHPPPRGLKVYQGLLSGCDSRQALASGSLPCQPSHPPCWPSRHVHLWDHLYISDLGPSLHLLRPLFCCISAPCPALWAATWSQDPPQPGPGS